ncbi:MAG: hypothetical protein NVSMB65_05330 [Chloroflexota bacterium]
MRTVNTTAPARPRGTNRRTILVGMLCLALVCCWAPTFALGAAQAAADPLRFVPTTALLYAQVDLGAANPQSRAFNRLVDVFTHQKGYTAASAGLRASLGISSAGRTRLWKTLGRVGSVARVALFAAGTPRAPAVNGLLLLPLGASTASPQDVVGLVRDIVTSVRPTGLYNGHILYALSFGGTPLPAAVVDGTLILGISGVSSQADHLLRVSLDTFDGRRASLSASPSVARVMASLPSQRFALVFINSRRLLQWTLGMQGGPGFRAGAGVNATGIQALLARVPSVGVALQALPRGLRLVTSRMTLLTSTAPRALNVLTARYAAPDSLAYLAVAGLGASVVDALHQAQGMAGGGGVGASGDLLHTMPGLRALEQQAHLNVERDVLPLLNGELGLSVSLKSGITAASSADAAHLLQFVRVRAALQLTNPAATGVVLAKLNDWVRAQTAVRWQRISPTTQGMMEPGTAIGYKMNEQWLFAGTQINEHWSGGLSALPTFSESLDAVADRGPQGQHRPTMILYVSLDAARDLLDTALTGPERSRFRHDALPFLRALHSLMVAARVGPDGAQSLAVFVGLH